MSNNCPIGVFDSGVGGLSVFSQLIKLLPDENYIYFGDTANLPYGNKSQAELVNISTKIFDFFKSKKVKAVVMACNTTSALTYEILKDKYDFKIYPVVQNVAEQIAKEGHKKIGVFATQGTVNSHAYKNELQKHDKNIDVFEIACPEWVSIVENELQEDNNSIKNVKMILFLLLVLEKLNATKIKAFLLYFLYQLKFWDYSVLYHQQSNTLFVLKPIYPHISALFHWPESYFLPYRLVCL